MAGHVMSESISPVGSTGEDAGTEMAPEVRPALFISHANPEDNEFAIWLGGRLCGAGYEVWADVLSIRGGQDWARKLENALRRRARKVLLVGTARGVEKQGVRNEIQIATEVGKRIRDEEFVIPLRLQQYESPFQIVQAQYIDFMNGWGAGLAELLETLDGYGVPRAPSFHAESMENWRAVQLVRAKAVERVREELVSNWVEIIEWPRTLHYFAFRGAVGEARVKAMLDDCQWPVYPYRQGFLSWAEQRDFRFKDGESFPLSREREWWSPYFLQEGARDLGISKRDAQKIASHLTRCAVENHLRDANLGRYAFAGGVSGWWVPRFLIHEDKVVFNWPGGPSGRRQLVGEVTKGMVKYNWHFGVSCKPWLSPMPHIRLLPRIVFSEDGLTPLDDVEHMHRLRRSVPRFWRNERWRDLLLAFVFWWAKGERHIAVQTGSNSFLKLAVPPVCMACPVSVKGEGLTVDEDVDIEADDPVFGTRYDELDEDDEEGSEDADSEEDEKPAEVEE